MTDESGQGFIYSLKSIPRERVVYLDGTHANLRGPFLGDTTELQETMREIGQVVPCVFGPRTNKGWPLLDGARRIAAGNAIYNGIRGVDADAENARAHWSFIPGIVIDNLDISDADMVGRVLIAFTQQQQLNPVQLGHAIMRAEREWGWGLIRAAKHFAKSVPEAMCFVAAAQASEVTQKRLTTGELSWSAWKKICQVHDPEKRENLAMMERPTVDRVRKAIRGANQNIGDLVQSTFTGIRHLQSANNARAIVQDLINARSEWENDPSVVEQINYLLHDVWGIITVWQEEDAR